MSEINQTKPLWVHTVGFTNHGKTVYLSLLLSYIEKISYLWLGAHFRLLNDHALNHIQICRTRIEKGVMPQATPRASDFPIPVLIHLKNMKRWGNRCLIMHDAAGETYGSIQSTSASGQFIQYAKTSIFIVSLSEIEKTGARISDIFDIYITALENMNASTLGRSIVIVYTKADQLRSLPQTIRTYLEEDKFWENFENRQRDYFNDDDMRKYMERMNDISDQLRQYTIDNVNLGVNVINSAEARGINLKFSVTSALGSPTDHNNTMTQPVEPQRVFDPLFWVLDLDSTDRQY